MKVLLIQPKPQHAIPNIHPRYISEESGIYPPLGLLYLAASVEKGCNADVQILDLAAHKLNRQQIKREIQISQPHLVGITVTSFTLLESLDIAQVVKSIDPEIHVCLGGPHPTLFPEETTGFQVVNSVVMGEGEITFPEMINHLEKGISLSRIAGLTYKNKNGEIIKNKRREFISSLDTLPFPARHLLPAKQYRSIIGENFLFTTLLSSRGCIYNCLYCYHSMGKHCRNHSVEYMMSEINQCQKQGFGEFWYFDDNFITSRQRIFDFCQALIHSASNICWHAKTRMENLDPQLIEKMAEAGCKRISMGIESASTRVLKVLRKETDLTKVHQKIGWLKSMGIKTYLDFMIGSPGETRPEIEKTIHFARQLDADYVQFALLVPYPQTPLYQQILKQGLCQNDPWQEFARAPTPSFSPPLANEHFSRRQLMVFIDRAYRKFYWRPKHIVRELLTLKSLKDLFFKGKAALRIIFHNNH